MQISGHNHNTECKCISVDRSKSKTIKAITNIEEVIVEELDIVEKLDVQMLSILDVKTKLSTLQNDFSCPEVLLQCCNCSRFKQANTRTKVSGEEMPLISSNRRLSYLNLPCLKCLIAQPTVQLQKFTIVIL
ncbi:MAG: hypothetical protein HC895_12485 [Leptolyngbyaceae cyanobacterium SM1_3_5]|nr:hypothetical protein [Leptolyngbyaceae cyanobacterium SM1_3_5]